MQIDGICETSPVKNSGNLTSQHGRSYLDIENEQDGGTSEKGEGEPTLLRKTRRRLSTTLRKSLAWDKAFSTDEGVLDNDELFAGLATISDGPQNVIASFEERSTPTKSQIRPEVSSEAKTEVRLELRPEAELEVRPQNLRTVLRPKSRPASKSKPQQDLLHSTSLRPVRQIQTGSQAFSSASSRVAATSQWFPSIPLSTNFSKLGKQLGGACSPTIEHTHGTNPCQMKEPPNTCIAHEARPVALKIAHEAPSQMEPWARLPTTRKVQDKPLEEIHKVKQIKKVELNPSMEMQKMKQPKEAHATKQVKKLEVKPVEETQKLRQPFLNRSMSTPNLPDSPSTPCRKVSSMPKKMTETREKVMAVNVTEHAPTVFKEPSLSHIHPVDNTLILSTVPEVKASNRMRSNAAATKGSSTQASSLVRSKSACAIPGQPKATSLGHARGFTPSAPPPKVHPLEPVGRPTSLRRPPKLGFFDVGRASSAKQKAAVASQPFQGIQHVRSGSEASTPIPLTLNRLHELAAVTVLSPIPSAPLLRNGVASVPSSPKRIHVIHPSPSKCSSTTITRASSPIIERVALPVYYSGIGHATQFPETHHLLAKKMVIENGNGGVCTAPHLSGMDSFKLPEVMLGPTELDKEPAGLSHVRFATTRTKRDSVVPLALGIEDLTRSGSRLETGENETDDNNMHAGLQTSDCSEVYSSLPLLGSNSHVFEISASKNSERSSSIETSEVLSQTCDELKTEGSFLKSSLQYCGNLINKPLCLASSDHQNNQDFAYHPGKVFAMNSKTTLETSLPNVQLTVVQGLTTAVTSFEQTSKATRDSDLPHAACPTTPANRDSSRNISAQLPGQFECLQSTSFRETSVNANASGDSLVASSKFVRRCSQRQPWQCPGGKFGSDASPNFCPPTFASGKHLRSASPTYAPDVGGTFEILTLKGPKNVRCGRTSGSSLKVVRTILEFGSPTSQWCDWPVLGGVFSEYQISGSSEEKPADYQRVLTKQHSTDVLLNCPMSDLSTSANIMFAEMDAGFIDDSIGLNRREVCGLAKKEKGSSMFSFARKAFSRLTSSPTLTEPSTQNDRETARPHQTSPRFSRSGRNHICPAIEPITVSPFSESRICELEAAGSFKKNEKPPDPFDRTKPNQHTRSVHRDVLCTPLQLEISRNPLLQHAWFSSCQWLGTRARRPSKIKLRNVGRAKEFCSSFSC
ncbi:uncharacterized protein [Physcomitrium patens]|nr:uncharacterized protein LOC112277440 isoform X1 [Physcomitrium patens]XP_024365520.1 uncharacterized protein LOC112277440 isoform X1 [Physcomitrium patens]XP_024365521.1 uncharacterized protein LOC112277440 isoform X1 [Physcomitrium patens]XP_024365522.1 uncharacterized protein LOC112277440 isoform X1 [Physcomitrium patens]XP_024365523.1 uncharacterized protein LOC112277440 isoform X1 [Physcomitrium patens]XP_024365524.1 uncharacterized protein LOC112277440 isoform X1 [Physcomitrium patens]|eukprot:XP_024365518.1 uncharacterized protein LOC112277440 isoform X1 [Physcomitrella patens]